MQLKKTGTNTYVGANDGVTYTVKGGQVISSKTGKALSGPDLQTFNAAKAAPGTNIVNPGFGTKTSAYVSPAGLGGAPVTPATLPGAPGTTPPVTTDTSGNPSVDPAPSNTNALAAANAYVDSLIGKIQPLDLSGAPKVLDYDDLQAQRQATYQSLYNTSSANDAENKQKDLAATQQDLANRGIPIDAASDPSNPNNLYGNSIKDINTQYDQKDQAEKDSAQTGADSALSTYVAANTAAHSAYTSDASTQFQSQLDSLSGVGSLIAQLTSQYGIDADTAKAILASKTQKYVQDQQDKTAITTTNLNNAPSSSGGGGSSSSGSSSGGGFQII